MILCDAFGKNCDSDYTLALPCHGAKQCTGAKVLGRHVLRRPMHVDLRLLTSLTLLGISSVWLITCHSTHLWRERYMIAVTLKSVMYCWLQRRQCKHQQLLSFPAGLLLLPPPPSPPSPNPNSSAPSFTPARRDITYCPLCQSLQARPLQLCDSGSASSCQGHCIWRLHRPPGSTQVNMNSNQGDPHGRRNSIWTSRMNVCMYGRRCQ